MVTEAEQIRKLSRIERAKYMQEVRKQKISEQEARQQEEERRLAQEEAQRKQKEYESQLKPVYFLSSMHGYYVHNAPLIGYAVPGSQEEKDLLANYEAELNRAKLKAASEAGAPIETMQTRGYLAETFYPKMTSENIGAGVYQWNPQTQQYESEVVEEVQMPTEYGKEVERYKAKGFSQEESQALAAEFGMNKIDQRPSDALIKGFLNVQREAGFVKGGESSASQKIKAELRGQAQLADYYKKKEALAEPELFETNLLNMDMQPVGTKKLYELQAAGKIEPISAREMNKAKFQEFTKELGDINTEMKKYTLPAAAWVGKKTGITMEHVGGVGETFGKGMIWGMENIQVTAPGTGGLKYIASEEAKRNVIEYERELAKGIVSGPIQYPLTTTAIIGTSFALPVIGGAITGGISRLGIASAFPKAFAFGAGAWKIGATGVAYGGLALYGGIKGYQLYNAPSWAMRGQIAGQMYSTELMPGLVGGLAGARVAPYARGYASTFGLKKAHKVPEEMIVPQEVISGEQKYYQWEKGTAMTQQEQIVFFQQGQYRMPNVNQIKLYTQGVPTNIIYETKPLIPTVWHLGMDMSGFEKQFIVKDYLYGAPIASEPFLKLSEQSYGFYGVKSALGVPEARAIYPISIETGPTISQVSNEKAYIAWVNKFGAKGSFYTHAAGWKAEAEALSPSESIFTLIEKPKFYTTTKGPLFGLPVRVPIGRYQAIEPEYFEALIARQKYPELGNILQKQSLGEYVGEDLNRLALSGKGYTLESGGIMSGKVNIMQEGKQLGTFNEGKLKVFITDKELSNAMANIPKVSGSSYAGPEKYYPFKPMIIPYSSTVSRRVSVSYSFLPSYSSMTSSISKSVSRISAPSAPRISSASVSRSASSIASITSSAVSIPRRRRIRASSYAGAASKMPSSVPVYLKRKYPGIKLPKMKMPSMKVGFREQFKYQPSMIGLYRGMPKFAMPLTGLEARGLGIQRRRKKK